MVRIARYPTYLDVRGVALHPAVPIRNQPPGGPQTLSADQTPNRRKSSGCAFFGLAAQLYPEGPRHPILSIKNQLSGAARLVTRLLDPSGALQIRHDHLANESPCGAEAPTRQHIARIMNPEIYAADSNQQRQNRCGHYKVDAN